MGNKASASASFDVEASANVEAGANGEGPAKKKRKLSFSKLLPRRSASLAREKGNVEGGNGGGKHVRPLSYRGTADLDADVEFNSPDANISAEVTTPSASDEPQTSATAKARAAFFAEAGMMAPLAVDETATAQPDLDIDTSAEVSVSDQVEASIEAPIAAPTVEAGVFAKPRSVPDVSASAEIDVRGPSLSVDTPEGGTGAEASIELPSVDLNIGAKDKKKSNTLTRLFRPRKRTSDEANLGGDAEAKGGVNVAVPDVDASAKVDVPKNKNLKRKRDKSSGGFKLFGNFSFPSRKSDDNKKSPNLELSGDVKAPTLEGDIETPSVDIDVHAPKVEGDADISADIPQLPSGKAEAPDLSGGIAGGVDAEVKGPKVNASGGADVDLDVGLPAIKVKGKKRKGPKKKKVPTATLR